MRTIIEVPDDVIKHLDSLNRQEKKSRSAVIREAIQDAFEQTANGREKPKTVLISLGLIPRPLRHFIRYRMMNTSKLASFINFKSVISNFKYLGACPEDLYSNS